MFSGKKNPSQGFSINTLIFTVMKNLSKKPLGVLNMCCVKTHLGVF
jgi:hypothetical protein